MPPWSGACIVLRLEGRIVAGVTRGRNDSKDNCNPSRLGLFVEWNTRQKGLNYLWAASSIVNGGVLVRRNYTCLLVYFSQP